MNNAKFPDFSVLISVYANDDPGLFDRAICSILTNSLLPLQVVMVIDGPIGDVMENIVHKYVQNKMFKVVRIQENLGLANALNVGIQHVSADWIVRADADDLNHDDRFISLARFMLMDYDIIGSAIREVDIDGGVLGVRSPPKNHFEILKFASRRNPFNHMATCFRRDLAIKAGGYPNIFLREDYALWASMIHIGAKCINLSEVLVTATAGFAMYKRRGGIKYAIGEYRLQKHLITCGLKGPARGFLDGALRSFIFILGPSLRGFVYEKFLRTSAK